MKSYTSESPTFQETIQIPENTDPANADDILNVTYKALHDNSLALFRGKSEGRGIAFQVDTGYNLSGIFTDEEDQEHEINFPRGGAEDAGLSIQDGKICVTFER